jgi:hypothetical protein
MVEDDQVKVFADSHHHDVYQGPKEIAAFLNNLLEDDQAFHRVLSGILEEHTGLTVPEIYGHLRKMSRTPVVERYLDREFPHAPPTLQAVILLTLLDMNCRHEGPRRKKRFYLTWGTEYYATHLYRNRPNALKLLISRLRRHKV